MLKLLLVCAVISISIEVAFADAADRSHGKEKHVLTSCSMDRGIRHLCCRFRGRLCGFVERLSEREIIFKALGYQ